MVTSGSQYGPKVAALAGQVCRAISVRRGSSQQPHCIAIDGKSGVGKSTLAEALAQNLGATLLEGDDFFSGGTRIRADSPANRAADCIDWRRLRFVLDALRAGRTAEFRPFDWRKFDGSLSERRVILEPRTTIIVEGVYSGRPEMRDSIETAILLTTSKERRLTRLTRREGRVPCAWERQWHEAEDWYFANVVDAGDFHLRLQT